MKSDLVLVKADTEELNKAHFSEDSWNVVENIGGLLVNNERDH